MITTFEVVGMILLFIGLAIAIWWFVVAENFRKYLKTYSYSRGVHATQANQTLNLSCSEGKEICLYKATQICTNPDNNNFEDPTTDPIDSGTSANGMYGQFNPQTTVDLTQDMGSVVNGQRTATFRFTPKEWPDNMASCAGETQLIGTYTCIPTGTSCQSFSGRN